jgi:LPXTG-site transpeptidase (sortase) family protein
MHLHIATPSLLIHMFLGKNKHISQKRSKNLLTSRGMYTFLVVGFLAEAFFFFNSGEVGRDSIEHKMAYLAASIVHGNVLSAHDYSRLQESTSSLHGLPADSPFTDLLKPHYGFPKKLVIAAVDIKIDLISVGVGADGVMETPDSWSNGGWYRRSAKPGEPGNLIINAHYDDNTGSPAAFYSLKNINVGDKVLVVDSYGKVFLYSTTDVFLVDIDAPDKLDVLSSEESRAHMTMITCGGFWVSSKSTYSQRLVVTAELEGEFDIGSAESLGPIER